MQSNAMVVTKLYSCLDAKDHAGMAACYHPDARFEDIAFALRGNTRIHAMWHMISETDLRATFTVTSADGEAATADLVDDYTFRDTGRHVHNVIRSSFRFRQGLIVEHRDACDAFRWGIQALGPVKGLLSFLIPAIRRATANKKLKAFVDRHPEYADA